MIIASRWALGYVMNSRKKREGECHFQACHMQKIKPAEVFEGWR